jgi:hypothetical protein
MIFRFKTLVVFEQVKGGVRWSCGQCARSRKLSNVRKARSSDGWLNLLSWVFTCLGRHVIPLVSAAFSIVSTPFPRRVHARQATGCKLISESLSHDEKYMVPTPLSGIRVGKRKRRCDRDLTNSIMLIIKKTLRAISFWARAQRYFLQNSLNASSVLVHRSSKGYRWHLYSSDTQTFYQIDLTMRCCAVNPLVAFNDMEDGAPLVFKMKIKQHSQSIWLYC